MRDKEKQFRERVECDIACCEDTPNKQIEEMVGIINKVVANSCPDFNGYRVPEPKSLAEELLKYYQPNLPEDSVVLTKEEWNKYRAKNLKLLQDQKVQLGLEIRELRNDRDYWIEEYKHTRKETAREVIQWFLGRTVTTPQDLKEFAKKFGVEVKE